MALPECQPEPSQQPWDPPPCVPGLRGGHGCRPRTVAVLGEKPYISSKCDDTFTQQQSLKTHALTFSGEELLRCSNCEKAFTQHSIFRKT